MTWSVAWLVGAGLIAGAALFLNDVQSTLKENERSPALVYVEEGALLGAWVDCAQAHCGYAAFRGVPYAKPPVGPLRFKAPRPAAYWDGVRPAIEEESFCVQDHQGQTGSEDCLYLNVYTPHIPGKISSSQYPVFVFLHGGGFIFGGASEAEYGPEYLVQQGIVVVTVQYRLGAFGFLSLDTEDMPGNAGLKDQVAALRWVRRNIDRFGGDPEKVTLGGHAAGAISASWLSLLPSTKGLFRAVILQSGSAVHSFSYLPDPTPLTLEVARELLRRSSGDIRNNSIDEKLATQLCLGATERDLFQAGEAATRTLRTKLKSSSVIGADIAHSSLYNPSPERRSALPTGEELLITADAESYMISQERPDVPTIFGQTTREMGYFFPFFDVANNDAALENAIKNLITWTPPSLFPSEETRKILKIQRNLSAEGIPDTLQKYYFETDDSDCSKECRMAKLVDDVYFITDSSRFIRLRAKYARKPTYAYLFSFQSDYNQPPRDPRNRDHLRNAVIHGDDLGYIWRTERSKGLQDLNGTGKAAVALRRQVAMWANFIKYGDPTPSTNAGLLSVRWAPVRHLTPPAYLEIGENMTMQQGVFENSNSPWAALFSSLRDNKSL